MSRRETNAATPSGSFRQREPDWIRKQIKVQLKIPLSLCNLLAMINSTKPLSPLRIDVSGMVQSLLKGERYEDIGFHNRSFGRGLAGTSVGIVILKEIANFVFQLKRQDEAR